MNRPPGRITCALLLTLLFAPAALAAGKAHHVLIVVMDGLRRDSVTAENMPTLYGLARGGTFFDNHHPVYLSTTEVNGTALATGMAPADSGIMANREYRPDVDLLRPVDTQGQWAAWKGDRLSDDSWIRTRTLPELARAAGLKTAVAGTKGVAIVWDRGIKNRTVDQPTVFEGKAIPSATLDKVLPDMGPLPPGVDWKHLSNNVQDNWTTHVLTDKLWADGVPSLSVLWLSEPDFSQHGTGPGSEQCKLALKSSDDRLATALKALDDKGVRNDTDVLVVSDHGFSTIYRKIDMGDILRKRKFKAEGTYYKKPEPGNILVVGLGGTVTFYVIGHDMPTRDRLVAFLQTTDYAGVLFTRDGVEGTFKLADAGLDTPNAPDVVMALRWKDQTMRGHMPGTVVCDGMDVGQGTHGSLSRFDLHNTLIASGPDFKSGYVNKLPSANSDVAPTVAHILGITPPRAMDGRVLAEALADSPTAADANPSPQTATIEASRDNLGDRGDKSWSQYLQITTYQNRRYYDEGNAGAPPAQ
ncbi:MAG TPA: alkaline phosphatase family protein [Tepidisphaeraceae bacterium]|jgi:predicted AlkP superfamily pyrophosphatase or phosphodiesterase